VGEAAARQEVVAAEGEAAAGRGSLSPSWSPIARGPRADLQYSPMLKHIAWKDVAVEHVNPLFDRQLITGENLMFARILLKKGMVVPEHSHHNEQLTFVVEGALKFWIDSREIVVRSGEVLCIPPHMPHKAEALEDTIDMDIFYPPRQDWLNKSDAYLRNEPVPSR
jgi:quercetin dioxygenase-like cupin family protein